ncbi:MAG TPA: hypothetical protein VNO30_08790 [Kofleriaceae bacterium]|nr:hypothetical protein [Kofleriaceae bacterium]
MRSLPAVTAAALLAACYTPQPQPGAPCSPNGSCPHPLVCAPQGTCEAPGGSDGDPQVDAPPVRPDGCATGGEICGNGIDEDCDGVDLACAGNDRPTGAIDVTAGGTFDGDARLARDDVAANGCGGEGGRDLFFRVTLMAPQVYYFDTLDSAYDTVIRVYAKSCAAVGAGAGAAACSDDACGGGKSQVAAALPAGESCIVVDQRDGAQPGGALKLRVMKGGRDGRPLARGAQVTTGDTCSATNASEPIDQNCNGPGSLGKDHAYFFTTCPGETLRLDADTCPEPDWDTVLYVKRVSGEQLGCNDDDCGWGSRITNVALSGSSLYFLFIDGFDDVECGTYSLDTNLRP